MKDTIDKLQKKYSELERSLALQNWIPGIFDGPGKVRTQLVSRPSRLGRLQVYKMIVTNAKGEVTDYPVEQVPDALLFKARP
jgi:hypothetical protein